MTQFHFHVTISEMYLNNPYI